MLRFFRRSWIKRTANKRRRVKLAFERLEDRNCPSGFVSFQETQLQGQLVGLSGTIDDDNPAADTIVFSGVVSGQTTPNADGSFSLQADASGLGEVDAAALDTNGNVFDTATAYVASAPPSLTLSASYTSANAVVLSGQVSDDQPGGLEVDFSGAVSGSALTDASGNFSLTTTVPASGIVQATTTDIWGQAADAASVWASAPPSLTLSANYGSDGSVTLSGQVNDDQSGGLTVNFSGAVSGSATTDGSGNFSLTTTVGTSGTVQASTTDYVGQTATASVWASAPPSLTLSTSYGSDGTVTLSGQVSDDDPSGLTVSFSGAVWGSTTTDGSGNFSLTTNVGSSGTVQASTTDDDGQTASATVWASAPPSMTLSTSYGSDGTVTLSGQVSDDDPSGLTVSFSGAVWGSTTTDGSGNFSLTTNVGSSGTVQASTTDDDGQTASATVWASAPPSMTLSTSYGSDGTVTLSGQVSDDQPSGLTVSFSGAVSGSATTDGSGNFSLTTTVGTSGTVQASTTDNDGQTATASVWASAPPSLTLSTSYGSDGTVTLSGQVSDDDPSGLTVSFSGAVWGSTTTDGSGNFSLTTNVGSSGTVQASTTDDDGQTASATVWASAPPSMTLSTSYGSDGTVTLSGQVSDDDPSGLTVSFSGAVWGSTTTDGSGNFSLTTNVGSSGPVQASTTDDDGQTASATVWASAPPSLTLSTSYGSDGTVTLSGQVSDDQPSGLTVSFGGAVWGSTTTDGSGNFSLTTTVGTSGTVQASTTDNDGQAATASVWASAPPSMTLSTSYGSDGTVTLSGQVSDDEPSGLTVSFSGAVWGSTTTDGSGNFSLSTSVASSGTVQASTTDDVGQTATASVWASAPPSLTLSVSYGPNNTVTLSGQVSDDQPACLEVNFTGAVCGSAVTDESGNFSLTTTAPGSGDVEADVTDNSGQTASSAAVWVTAPPTVSLTVNYGVNNATSLSGTVSCDQPSGLTVNFTGAYVGSTVTDGSGAYCLPVTVTSSGTITAVVTDNLGQTSAPTSLWVEAPPAVSLSVGYGPGQTITLSGLVNDDQPGGLTVTFGGAVDGSTVTNADGTFSLVTTVASSGAVTATTFDSLGLESNSASVWVSAPPALTLTVSYVADNVILSGQVNDDEPGGLTVTFTGAVNGSTVTNADGSYSLETTVPASGTVTAATVDNNGLTSNPVSAWLAAPPTLTLAVSYGDERTITLSGQVSDDQPGGLTVTFSGAATGTAVTDADGNYSVTLQASSLGIVSATVTDGWGMVSNPASVTLAVAPPAITDNSASNEGENIWCFQGTVAAASPDGVTVTFNGIPTVANQTAPVQVTGLFIYIVQLQPNEEGTVTVQATDCWGQTSAIQYYFVDS